MRIESVMVIGCGGLGGFVIEELARLGIQNLVLVDGDVFAESNMNRQLESGLDTLGKNKALVYKSRLERKGRTHVTAVPEFFSEDNASLLDSVDVVMDCVDTAKARLFIEKKCEERGKIFVHGGLEGSFGQACVCFPGDKTLSKFYANHTEQPHRTNAFTVATVASLQVALLNKLMADETEEIKNKLVLVDLDSFTIDVIKV
ncbi:MAG: ThiF family adenylyltransferase [Clostridia bacterium]|nr:ThiF family adenylyltransferase [Clostridia bacterium]